METGLAQADLAAILQTSSLEAIVIPKVEHAWHVQLVSSAIEAAEQASQSRREIRLIPCIETALGLLNLREIAGTDPRVDALVVRARPEPSRRAHHVLATHPPCLGPRH